MNSAIKLCVIVCGCGEHLPSSSVRCMTICNNQAAFSFVKIEMFNDRVLQQFCRVPIAGR